ncbi:hypothetical protein NCCP1664_00470 [Zafaria cholistanensis]|uniref:Uncharacterized protein n=1 Tax=Zafaria cholistanensis TaxID=1682741 RepID=A0A5A7NLA0_9MICC|nr:NF038396 family protein [Zafaria cholistanensis]GER21550.1 hypothetical protein NCCP1664_00470 [Zafaria cholistanensis]
MKEAFKALANRPEPLFVIGYMLCPLLALICAALGLWMILTGQKAGGLVVLLVVTQAFTFTSLWAIGRRRRLLESHGGGPHA